jgi:uncharacterized membrane protein (Fun14 family)
MYICGYTWSRRKGMNIENISSIVATSSEGFFASFLIGYFIKKVIKILMFVFGGILALLMYLHFQDIIDVNIKLDKFQGAADAIINTILANSTAMFSNDNHALLAEGNVGISVVGSVSAGFVLGFTRRG